jgi:hypothetical protein
VRDKEERLVDSLVCYGSLVWQWSNSRE